MARGHDPNAKTERTEKPAHAEGNPYAKQKPKRPATVVSLTAYRKLEAALSEIAEAGDLDGLNLKMIARAALAKEPDE